MPPRRFSTLIFVVAAAVAVLFIFSASSRQIASNAVSAVKDPAVLRGKVPTFEVPKFRFSLYQATQKPPEQKNSTSGDSSWYTDWRWLNPFSSSVTLDENRAVLPPLPERPVVYTYYDTSAEREEQISNVDKKLILTWRRAWWAHGFRPVILTQAEAMNNPLFQDMHQKGMPAALEFEITRWLAWGHMGSGLLSSWHCLPMGAYDDLLLSHLRRGQYEHLTRFEGLGAGLFAGEKDQINGAIKDALSNLKLSTFHAITDAISAERFKIEQPASLAHYDSPTITAKYPALAQSIVDHPNRGRLALNDLMNSHLHTIWQNTFSNGIAVLKPLPLHTSSLVEPGIHLANLLSECPESILQSSCPPNRPKCNPCVGTRMRVSTPASFKNTSSLYTISTVPHPFTMITLNNQTYDITIAHIRRQTERDSWIEAVTRDTLGDGRDGLSRIVSLKDAIASEYGRTRSLWFTVEQFPVALNPPPMPPKSPTNDAHPEPVRIAPFPEHWLEGIDWHFGFSIPRTAVPHGESLPPVPGPERWPKSPAGLPAERKKSSDPDPPTELEAAVEVNLLQKARDTINSKDVVVKSLRDAAEMWNLADTEAWKFVRAYRARSVVERMQWEEQESLFATIRGGKGKTRWWV